MTRKYWTERAIELALEAADIYGYATNRERTRAIKTYRPLVELFKNEFEIYDEDAIGDKIMQKLRQVHPKGDKNPEKDGRKVKRRFKSTTTIKPMQSTPSFVTPTESSDREPPIRKSLFESSGKKFERTPSRKISVTKRSHEKIFQKNISWPERLKFERLTHGYSFFFAFFDSLSSRLANRFYDASNKNKTKN